MSARLTGRVAVVTGGGRGQGRAHAIALAREGARVLVCDAPPKMDAVPYETAGVEDLAETRRLVEAAGGVCLAEQADVRDPEALGRVVAAANERLGPVDILCATAGVLAFGALAEADRDVWEVNLDVNLTGIYNSVRAVLPTMLERERGRIIATSSAGGRIGYANLTAYCAAKWGVIGLVKALALEVAAKNITVNAIVPGMVDSDMINNPSVWGLFRPDLDAPTRDDVMQEWVRLTPNGAGPLPPSEISKSVVFLASDDAQQITGTSIDISSGQSGTYTA